MDNGNDICNLPTHTPHLEIFDENKKSPIVAVLTHSLYSKAKLYIEYTMIFVPVSNSLQSSQLHVIIDSLLFRCWICENQLFAILK